MHDRETSTRILAEKVVDGDLLGPDAIFESEEPATPRGYRLVRCLGRGGCGVVWLADDTRLDRPVAIKFLNDAGAADMERFRREARYTARLRDPGIVQVYELGETEESPYIAMQYIDGGNLGNVELDPPGVVRVLRDVGLALTHAHAEGIVHRDIKPENILLDRARRAYLTDFGIARNLQSDIGDTIATEGQIMGTPGLMPPEQARGEIQAVDARSDVYALGATMYLKLTGHYPFEATHVVDVLHAVIHNPPPLMRSRNAAVPRTLETIAFKCMQKAREDRYQSVEEVVEELDRFLNGADTGGGGSAWLRRLISANAGVDEPATVEDLHADPYWTEGMELVREIAAWDTDLYRVSGSLTRSFKRLDTIRRRLDEILQDRPETAWARFYRGVALFRRGRLDEALEEMERAIDRVKNLAGAYFELGRLYIALHLREQHVARKHLSEVGVRDGLASSRGRLEQAILAFEEAQRLGGDLPPWLRDCTTAVARLSESDFDGCVAICDRVLAEEPDVEGVWKLRGDAMHLAGADPFESYDRALDVRRSYFEALLAKANAQLARDRIEEARESLRRALKIHPEYVDAAALLARTYLVETRRGAGGAAIDEGIELARRAVRLDPRHYDATITLAELEIEKGRAGGGDAALASAIATLDGAGALDGCRNRVLLLATTARLERARRAAAEGRDPRPFLEEVLAACRHEGAQVSDNEPWEAIRVEAEEMLARL